MKKTFRTLMISLMAVLMLFTSCNDKLQKMEEGSVNEYIYPYIKFKPAEDGNSVTAVVVAGSQLNTVKIPATVDGVKVNTFIGFENPEDAKSVKEIVVGSHDTVITDEALKQAINLEKVHVEKDTDIQFWGKLPVLEKDGYGFVGWYAGDELIYDGMMIDPEHSVAEPVWMAHEYVYHEGKPATCTSSGTREYWQCSVCNRKFATNEGKLSDIITDVEIPKLNHNLVYHELVKPTCTEPGTRAHYECSICHQKFSDENGKYPLDSIEIPKSEHDLVYKPEVPATCQEVGYRAFYVCRNCDQKFEDKDGKIPVTGSLVIDKLDHVFEEKWTTDDSYHWHYCSLCHKEKSDYELHNHSKKVITKQPGPGVIGEYVMECECGHRTAPVPMTNADHTFKSEITLKPTCTTTGIRTYTCTVCGYNYTVELPAINHMYSYKVVGKEPNCLEEGIIDHWHCPDCGLNFTDDTFSKTLEKTSIDKLDHKYETIWRYDKHNHWHECELCHKDKIDVAKHNHSEKVITKEPGPGEIGEYVMKCECGHETDPIPMTNADHTFDAGVKVEPTCTVAGSITYTCTKCGYVYTVEVSALNHKYAKKVVGKAATCFEEGVVDHWHCPNCGLDFTDDTFTEELKKTTIDKLEHKYETKWSFDKDNHWHECELCHVSKIDVAKHNHSEKVITKQPGPGEIGEYVMECECGHRTDPIPMTENDHNLGILSEKKPTCTEDGSITYYCKDEGCKFTYTVVVPKKNHENSYEVKAKAPTCTVDGNIYHWHCEDCGLNYTDGTFKKTISNVVIDKLGHDFTGAYFDDGKGSHYQKCSRCDAENTHEAHEYNLSEKLPNDLNIYHDATCTEAAEYYKTCKCGAFNSNDKTPDNLFTAVGDKPLGHILVKVPAKPSTCTVQGNIEYWKCTRYEPNSFFSDENATVSLDETEILLPLAPHVYAGKAYRMTNEGHYPICDVCGQEGPFEKHNKDAWNHNSEQHWKVCSKCGQVMTVKENHNWAIAANDDRYCIDCGFVQGKSTEGGGFDVDEEIRTPSGTMESSNVGNMWTFRFINGNANYKPDRIEWYVNEVKQAETSDTFVLHADRPRSYTVMCVYINRYGAGSSSETITGENDR